MRFGDDGRLLRDQPRGRLLRRRARHRRRHQRQRHRDALRQQHLHQRRADRRRRRVVGGPDRRAAGAPDRLEGQRLDARQRRRPAAHPNARFTAPGRPVPDRSPPKWEDPAGVPISAILFGGRRATAVPLVTEALRLAARRLPRRHRRARRRPPRPRARSASCAATRSRCCRSAATTWATTSATGSRSAQAADADKLPRIYYVNWFRKDADGKFLWPGFGENSRVLKWIVERLEGQRRGRRDRRSAALPAPGALDVDGPRHLRRRTSPSCSTVDPTRGWPRPTSPPSTSPVRRQGPRRPHTTSSPTSRPASTRNPGTTFNSQDHPLRAILGDELLSEP